MSTIGFAGMPVWRLREELKKHPTYAGPTWSSRVDKMSDTQVFAVYARMKRAGDFEGGTEK
jgi:hypothetical protein